eukprot:Rhum_TRINITY_DN14605_c4_g2::Rhum_TRINITY_DN14605_c4_g2_i1::g.103727::m.103727
MFSPENVDETKKLAGDLLSKGKGIFGGLKDKLQKKKDDEAASSEATASPRLQSTASSSSTAAAAAAGAAPAVSTAAEESLRPSSSASDLARRSSGNDGAAAAAAPAADMAAPPREADDVLLGIQRFINTGGGDVLSKKQTLALLTKTARHVNAKHRELVRHRKAGEDSPFFFSAEEAACLEEITAFFAKLELIRFKCDPSATEAELSEISLELFPTVKELHLTGLQVLHVRSGHAIETLVLTNGSCFHEGIAEQSVFPNCREVEIEAADPLNVLSRVSGNITGLSVSRCLSFSLQKTLEASQRLLLLTRLEVVECGWAELPVSLRALTELTALSVSGNSISALANLGCCKRLQTLDISGNRVSSLACLVASSTAGEGSEPAAVCAEHLTSLDASNNPISETRGVGPWLEKLTQLNLADCKISDWNQLNHIFSVPSLKSVFLKGNPLYSQPGLNASARCLIIDILMEQCEHIDQVLEKEIDGTRVSASEVRIAGLSAGQSVSPPVSPGDDPIAAAAGDGESLSPFSEKVKDLAARKIHELKMRTEGGTQLFESNENDDLARREWPNAAQNPAGLLVLDTLPDSPRSPSRDVTATIADGEKKTKKAKKTKVVVKKQVSKGQAAAAASAASADGAPLSPRAKQPAQTAPQACSVAHAGVNTDSSGGAGAHAPASAQDAGALTFFVDSIWQRAQQRLGVVEDKAAFEGWEDGMSLSALLHGCSTSFVDYHNLNPKKGSDNVQKVLDVADARLGVPKPDTGARFVESKQTTAAYVSVLLIAIQGWEADHSAKAKLTQQRLVDEVHRYRAQRARDRNRIRQLEAQGSAKATSPGGAAGRRPSFNDLDSISLRDSDSSADEAGTVYSMNTTNG